MSFGAMANLYIGPLVCFNAAETIEPEKMQRKQSCSATIICEINKPFERKGTLNE